MTGDEVGRAAQRVRDRQVAEAVAAERQRIGGQLHALSADPFALRRWVARHGLVDAGRGATLDAVAGDVLGVCGMCEGLREFVGGASVDAEPARECPARVAEAEERAWHRGWAAGWRRCAEKIAAEIEADAGSHECAWGFDAVEIARLVGAEAQRSEVRVRHRARNGEPAFEPEASFDRHGGDGDGRKPVDAYPTDQTGPRTL